MHLKKRKLRLVLGALCSFAIGLSTARSSELVYTPINPSFGGNVVNGSYLLGLANAQKQFQINRSDRTPLEEFNDRLASSLLSRVTSAVTRDIVDSSGNITPGFFETSDFTIEIIDDGSGIITIITTDKATGDQSIIEVENEDE